LYKYKIYSIPENFSKDFLTNKYFRGINYNLIFQNRRNLLNCFHVLLEKAQEMKNFIFVLVVLNLFIKCKKEDKETNPSTFDYIVKIDSGFKVALKSNPTTGYSWQWTNTRAVPIIDSIGYSFVADTPVLCGSGGQEIWEFKGVKPGIDTLIFKYKRPWEKNSAIESKYFIVKVN
jgi:predicted secreted protein